MKVRICKIEVVAFICAKMFEKNSHKIDYIKANSQKFVKSKRY